ncbi:MAG: hypothetical protein C0599_10120 [Salinivirgaceae bacterium]|nr:MAG: hypothetical protein C0599_10120 [Salinivirgaceae bacterium]
MPGLNHKGPNGDGPKTGRGLGNCGPKNQNPEQDNDTLSRGLGRRIGRGMGNGRGLGNGNYHAGRKGRDLRND